MLRTVEIPGPGDEVPCANSNCGHAKLCHAGGKGACNGIIPIANPDGEMVEEPCSCQRFVYDDQIVCARCGHTHECHRYISCIGTARNVGVNPGSACGCDQFMPITQSEFTQALAGGQIV